MLLTLLEQETSKFFFARCSRRVITAIAFFDPWKTYSIWLSVVRWTKACHKPWPAGWASSAVPPCIIFATEMVFLRRSRAVDSGKDDVSVLVGGTLVGLARARATDLLHQLRLADSDMS